VKKNKLGVSYNLFTGFELLEYSIKNIRDSVDYICVIYSLTSHHGQPFPYNFLPELKILKEDGLIDDMIEFKPENLYAAKSNESNQRNLGLEMCKKADCKYMMTMDVDEFYIKAEFDKAKKEIIKGNYDSSACQMITYYKYSNIIIDPPETYYVPFIYKINEVDRFGAKSFPAIVDNTRIYTTGKNILFKREDLQMHHMSYMRNSIREKLTYSCTPADNRKIDRIEAHYKNWNPFIAVSHVLTYHGFSKFKTLENPPFNIHLDFKQKPYAERKTF
jgi:hypothetical protein